MRNGLRVKWHIELVTITTGYIYVFIFQTVKKGWNPKTKGILWAIRNITILSFYKETDKTYSGWKRYLDTSRNYFRIYNVHKSWKIFITNTMHRGYNYSSNQLYIILINLNMYPVCRIFLNAFYMIKMAIHAVN